jgi:hypothetical protein
MYSPSLWLCAHPKVFTQMRAQPGTLRAAEWTAHAGQHAQAGRDVQDHAPSQWSFQGHPDKHCASAALQADLSQLSSSPCATVALAPTMQPQHRSCSWQHASVQLPS